METNQNGYNSIADEDEMKKIGILIPLYQPSLLDIISILTIGLRPYFEYVEVTQTTCPNLTLEPYNLAAKGLHGCETIIGCCVTTRKHRRQKEVPLWDLRELMQLFADDAFVIGGGCAARPSLPFNGTLIMNATYSAPDYYNNESCVVFKDTKSNHIRMETLRHPEDMICSMSGNFFVSKGEEGDVLKLCLKKRKTDPNLRKLNIIRLIENILFRTHISTDKSFGLGGILTIQKGRVTHKVLPDNIEINRQRTPKKLNKFYEKIKSVIRDKPCLVGLGTIVAESIDNWFSLRKLPRYFYTFLNNESGGRFSDDDWLWTADDIEYIGYFNIAKRLFLPKPISIDIRRP